MTDFGPTSPSASVMDIDATFLPVGQMRQISRVTKLAEAVIDAEVDLGPYHWVFPQHFPGDPIFPGTLMIEAAGQLVALWAWAQGQRGRPRLVRTGAEFHSPCWADRVPPALTRRSPAEEAPPFRHHPDLGG